MQEVAGGPASGGGESRPPCAATKSVSMSPRMEGPDKGQRGLRWTKHESLILVAAKSKELDRSLDSSAKGVDASDVKWVTIFQYCKDLGVERDASQCRKRWHSLYKDYKKIKDYEKLRGGSYWRMSAEQRREQKLASSFEHEVFDVLEDYCKKLPAVSTKATPEAAAVGKEEAGAGTGAGADEVESPGNGVSSEECGVGCSTDVTGKWGVLGVMWEPSVGRQRKEVGGGMHGCGCVVWCAADEPR